MKDYEIEMLRKIDSGKKLSKADLNTLVWEFNKVDRTVGENRRWSRTVDSIIEISGRFFKLTWEEGLTECQENEFYEKTVEV